MAERQVVLPPIGAGGGSTVLCDLRGLAEGREEGVAAAQPTQVNAVAHALVCARRRRVRPAGSRSAPGGVVDTRVAINVSHSHRPRGGPAGVAVAHEVGDERVRRPVECARVDQRHAVGRLLRHDDVRSERCARATCVEPSFTARPAHGPRCRCRPPYGRLTAAAREVRLRDGLAHRQLVAVQWPAAGFPRPTGQHAKIDAIAHARGVTASVGRGASDRRRGRGRGGCGERQRCRRHRRHEPGGGAR